MAFNIVGTEFEEVETRPTPLRINRVTLIEHAYHQTDGQSPVDFGSSFTKYLSSDEQAYSRRLTIDENWRELRLDWITDAALLLIKNREGEGRQTLPSPEEIEDTQSRMVEISIRGDGIVDFEIPAGESTRFLSPRNISAIKIRCKHISAKITITAIPN